MLLENHHRFPIHEERRTHKGDPLGLKKNGTYSVTWYAKEVHEREMPPLSSNEAKCNLSLGALHVKWYICTEYGSGCVPLLKTGNQVCHMSLLPLHALSTAPVPIRRVPTDRCGGAPSP